MNPFIGPGCPAPLAMPDQIIVVLGDNQSLLKQFLDEQILDCAHIVLALVLHPVEPLAIVSEIQEYPDLLHSPRFINVLTKYEQCL